MKDEMKSIQCDLVKVKRISDKGNCTSKADALMRIECGMWSFPCPSYSYTVIKERLEDAIKAVLDIKEVEVKSFSTGIIEYP